MRDRTRLGDLLIAAGLITADQLREALALQTQRRERLGALLVEMGALGEHDLLTVLSRQLGVPYVPGSAFPQTPVFSNTVSLRFLTEQRCLPIAVEDGVLTVAMENPSDLETVEALELVLGMTVRPCLGSPRAIVATLTEYANSAATAMERIVDEITPEEGELVFAGEDEDLQHLREAAQEAPVIRLVNLIISRAVEIAASDIHIEPFEGTLRIRYRIDGVLHDTEAPPKRLQAAIVSRVKIMAKMNIAERRLPQDGRIKLRVLNRAIDLRVATIPTVHGESVVMRILDRQSLFFTLDRLGFPAERLGQFERLIQRPYGIILVTGPTGSGKTTTLYAALDKINSPEKKIITIEDPVEYQLEGVNQIQVKPKIGLSFANGLRHIVRQDPDIILVGEIRDAETAEIAIQSALTGHLVFSTLHTNDAAGAVTRLQDMGIEPYLIASSVLGILAQRLVRLICRACAEPYELDAVALQTLGIMTAGGSLRATRGRGCEACTYTGYRGRTGIYELLLVDDDSRGLIMAKATAQEIKLRGMALGMRTLRQDGWDKVLRGLTAVSEVLRVTQEEGETLPLEAQPAAGSKPIPLTREQAAPAGLHIAAPS
ncbi:MAG: type II secretion system ATPase GspE [Candidatus Rokubacteria bacterium]|nr:type II secretion system ATPase GspE [Candidatus Rokubacteria bacterium]